MNGETEMQKHRRFQKAVIKKDMRYRGPLSYIALKFMGWLCLAAGSVMLVIKAANLLNIGSEEALARANIVLSFVKQLSLPFFLIGNFAIILDNKNGYKNQLFRNAGAMALIALAFFLLYYRYLGGLYARMQGDWAVGLEQVNEVFYSMTPNGFWDMNIFVDLSLCTLFMFFFTYKPRKHFQGKKLVLFRLLSLLPIAYEIASLTLKAMSADGLVYIPPWCFPLLTVKPPMTFIVFIVMAFFVKQRERRFQALGYTHGQFRAFLRTNRNSFHFSVFTAVLLLLAGLTDLVVYFLTTDVGADALTAPLKRSVPLALGVGDAVPLMMLSPLMLLFSYTRRHKNKSYEMFVPIVGMGIYAFAMIEGAYQLLLASIS